MGKDLIIKLCKRIVNNEKLNIGDFEYCDGIDCYKDSCPFAEKFNCILTESRKLEIAKKYLKDNEVKEENKMEKTFREVIADIKEGEVWESVQDCFQLSEITCFEGRIRFRLKNVFVDIVDGNNNVDTGAGGGQTFKLQRKEYTFIEAFKAYEEGKEIESCENGYKYLQNTFTYPGNEQWLCFRNSEQMFTTDAIRGKWYIND